MSSTDATTGFLTHDNGDDISNLSSWYNAGINPINDWAKKRMATSYVWADLTAQNAQTGMVAGSKGYRVDIDTLMRYSGSAWKTWEKPWAAYTPTVTGFSSATIAATTTGRYNISGGVCMMQVQSKLGTGTITVSTMSVTTPVTMDTTGMILDSTFLSGTLGFRDVSVPDSYTGYVRVTDASTLRLMRQVSSTAGQTANPSSTTPFTWATLDEMNVSAFFPVA